MIFNHAEPPLEGEEMESLEAIIEVSVLFEPEVIVENPHEYVPEDKYLEKEVERQKEEDLAEILPNRIP